MSAILNSLRSTLPFLLIRYPPILMQNSELHHSNPPVTWSVITNASSNHSTAKQTAKNSNTPAAMKIIPIAVRVLLCIIFSKR